jgi:hypothetical protein
VSIGKTDVASLVVRGGTAMVWPACWPGGRCVAAVVLNKDDDTADTWELIQ